jgi:hypothetical protein
MAFLNQVNRPVGLITVAPPATYPGGISTAITSTLASELYDSERNSAERGESNPTLYRAIAEQESPIFPNVNMTTASTPRWMVAVALASLVLAAIALFKK